MCWSEAVSGNASMPNHGCVGWLARSASTRAFSASPLAWKS